MARESAGIEVFGRGATTIDTSSRARTPRTPALGAASILLAMIAASAFAAAVLERARASELVATFVWIAIGVSAVAVLAGVVALVTSRGRLAGFLGVLLGLAGNPWVIDRLLEYAASLPVS